MIKYKATFSTHGKPNLNCLFSIYSDSANKAGRYHDDDMIFPMSFMIHEAYLSFFVKSRWCGVTAFLADKLSL